MTAPAWPRNAADAIALQNTLRNQVRIEDDFGAIRTIAGIDCSYDIRNNLSRAVVVVMERHALEPAISVMAFLPTVFPYIPGLLSFREIPVILEALSLLPEKPDLLMVDGQGIAHPRRLGIAAHLGIITGLPAIGVAKSRLTGTCDEPDSVRGSTAPLLDKNGLKIGTVLRSRDHVKPLFISPGHRIGHDAAVALTLECLRGYRLPEPTRIADKLSKVKV
ncbi:MAG: deoxyribonuclease V [Micavibrio aeruginosavorus]|nr:deoxyribonuclease V [Micavibrio aeruginosavorus]